MLESPIQCAEEMLCNGVTCTAAVTPHRNETLAGRAEISWGMHGNLPAAEMRRWCSRKYTVRARRLPHLTQLAFSWIFYGAFSQDHLFLDSKKFLAFTISGPHGLW